MSSDGKRLFGTGHSSGEEPGLLILCRKATVGSSPTRSSSLASYGSAGRAVARKGEGEAGIYQTDH
jgi:hypothetical protein